MVSIFNIKITYSLVVTVKHQQGDKMTTGYDYVLDFPTDNNRWRTLAHSMLLRPDRFYITDLYSPKSQLQLNLSYCD